MTKSAAAAYRADLSARDQPFGVGDGDWITVASLLEHATLVEEPTRGELLRESVELATKVVGAAEVRRLAERDWQDNDRTPSEAIVILADRVLAAGAANLAGTLLDSLLDADASLNVVQRGRILAKQARLEWKDGRLDDAAERYRHVEALGRRSKNSELRIRAWIGFASLSQMRGEYVEVERHSRRAARLAKRVGLARLSRDAHTGLMIAAGIDRRLDDALVHGWAVYQLSVGDDVDEAEVLVNLGQVLLDSRQIDAARAVFASVAARELPARLLLAALGGLALTSAASKHDLTTEWAGREVLRLDSPAAPRYSLTLALFECGLALTRIGRMKTAARCRSAALRLAQQHGFTALMQQFASIDESVAPTDASFSSALNKRAANVARRLASMEPRQLPRHVLLAAASA